MRVGGSTGAGVVSVAVARPGISLRQLPHRVEAAEGRLLLRCRWIRESSSPHARTDGREWEQPRVYESFESGPGIRFVGGCFGEVDPKRCCDRSQSVDHRSLDAGVEQELCNRLDHLGCHLDCGDVGRGGCVLNPRDLPVSYSWITTTGN